MEEEKATAKLDTCGRFKGGGGGGSHNKAENNDTNAMVGKMGR